MNEIVFDEKGLICDRKWSRKKLLLEFEGSFREEKKRVGELGGRGKRLKELKRRLEGEGEGEGNLE